MSGKKLGSAYKLFAKAIDSDNENVKDALETLLMITALTEGVDYHEDPLDEMRKQIASLQHEVKSLRIHIEYPKDYTSTWNPSYGPDDTYGRSSNIDYQRLKKMQEMMMNTPPTGILFPKDKI